MELELSDAFSVRIPTMANPAMYLGLPHLEEAQNASRPTHRSLIHRLKESPIPSPQPVFPRLHLGPEKRGLEGNWHKACQL